MRERGKKGEREFKNLTAADKAGGAKRTKDEAWEEARKGSKVQWACSSIFKQIFFHRADTRGVFNYENNLGRVLNSSGRFLRETEEKKKGEIIELQREEKDLLIT